MAGAGDRDLAELVGWALAEDLGEGDVTSEATVPDAARGAGDDHPEAARRDLRARAGAARLPDARSRTLAVEQAAPEGQWREAGSVVLVVAGAARALLGAERTALNFLGRLSGVATFAARAVAARRGHRRPRARHAQDDARAARAGEAGGRRRRRAPTTATGSTTRC